MQWSLFRKKRQLSLAALTFVLGFSLVSPLAVQAEQKKQTAPPASDGCKVKSKKKWASALQPKQVTQLKAGDTVGVLKVKSVKNDKDTGGDSSTYTVTFCEPIQISGSFTYANIDGWNFVIKPDDSSLKRIPHLKQEKAQPRPAFMLERVPPVLTEKFGEQETSGIATFSLNHVTLTYTVDSHATGTVTLSKMSAIKYISVAALPDGTKLYENRKPVPYKDIEVSIVNTGFSPLNNSPLLSDIAALFPLIPEEELRIIDVIDVKRSDKSKSPVRIVLVQHKDTQYYVALDYRKNAAQLGVKDVYALVAQIKGNQENAFEEVVKIIHSWTPNVYLYK